jgi:hypothetical protein
VSVAAFDRPSQKERLWVWSLPWREYAEEFSSAKARMQQNSSSFHAVLLRVIRAIVIMTRF